jgi:methylmalonyl-CoA/ethylmalonyl-CoA epimerase
VGPFTQVHHVCLVVADLDRAVAFYDSVGIGPWHDYPPLEQYTDLEVPDRHGFLGLRYKYADVGGLQFQLVQPGPADSPQKEFLRTKGEGVFHIGFSVDDVEAAGDQARGMGLDVLMRGRRPDGSGFTYFDTAPQAGVVLEVRQAATAQEGT